MAELLPAAILVATYPVLAVGQPPLLRIDRSGRRRLVYCERCVEWASCCSR